VILPLLDTPPPPKIRDGYRTFAQGGFRNTHATSFGMGGVRARNQCGILVTTAIIGSSGSQPGSWRIGVGLLDSLTSLTLRPVTLRDLLQDNAKRLGSTAFALDVAVTLPLSADQLSGVQISAGTFFPHALNTFVPKNVDLVFMREIANADIRLTVFGIEFLSQEARDWFRARLT